MRLIAKCRHRDRCEKKRSSTRVDTFGPSEPIASLAAWEAMGHHLTPLEHASRGLESHLLSVGEWVVLIGVGAEPLVAIAEGDP